MTLESELTFSPFGALLTLADDVRGVAKPRPIRAFCSGTDRRAVKRTLRWLRNAGFKPDGRVEVEQDYGEGDVWYFVAYLGEV